MRAIVETRARVDWVVDRHEIAAVASTLMQSACRVPPEARDGLRRWLDDRIEALGGSARGVYEQSGGDLEAAEELLTLERVRDAAAYADRHAHVDCPFWLEPDPGFAGVQASARRFVLMAESMGSLQVLVDDGEAFVGGTGVGRILPGWGVDDRLTLALGAELGVASTFPKGDDGGRSVKPVLAGGVPLLFRVHDETLRYDTEVAFVARAPEDALSDPRFGVRLAHGIGVATLRIAGVMPYAVLWAGYTWFPPADGLGAQHVVRFGTRVGVDWDP